MNHAQFWGGAAAPYEIEQSLRFDASTPARLTYDNTSGANNSSSAWTLSFWMKRGGDISSSPYGNDLHLMMWTPSGTCANTEYFLIADPNHGNTAIRNCISFNGGGYSGNAANKLRDPSAWYHFVWRGNTGSSSNIIYINGVPVTVYNQGPSSMTSQYVNGQSRWSIGNSYTGCSSNPWDGYLAEVHFVDGQTLDHEDFGEFDNNGVWRPIAYTGSYGTNGYYLKFDPSATNGIGHDHSGNGNNWTASGFSTSEFDYAATGSDPSSKIQSGSYQDFWDGNTSTGIIIGQGAYVQMTSTSLPSASSTVGFYTGNGASTATLRINGTEVFAATSTTIQWWDFSYSGAINKVEIGYLGGSGSSNTFRAFRVDGITITSNPGKDLDVLSDTPTTNWCTLNPISLRASFNNDCNDGNLGIETIGGTWDRGTKGTIGTSSGKWYWEYTHGTIASGYPTADIGITKYQDEISSYTSGGSGSADTYLIQGNNGNKYNANSGSSYGSAFTTGDICNIALDLDNGKVWFGKNGTYFNSGSPSNGTNAAFTGLSGTFWPLFYWGVSAGTSGVNQAYFNFGQRAFAYTPPTGFKALNTTNLPAPTIKDGGNHFNTVLYTGNGSTQSITGVGFQPDFVWSKTRSPSGYGHWLGDVVRGGNERLASDSTQEGRTNEGNITFDTDGFSVTSTHPSLNNNTSPIVAWNWLAGGTGSSNTDGDITSTVSANPTAGFSIVTYTGTNSNATVGHGLGVAPAMMIIKDRDAQTRWIVYHQTQGNAGYLRLDDTAAFNSDSTVFNTTSPSSTVFSVGTSINTNPNGNDVIAYCFAEVEGYSKFGSYTGNNSSDGTFVNLGFKPAWVMVKASTNSLTQWIMYDTARNTYNVCDKYLQPSNDALEQTGNNVEFDILSNGLKVRGSDQQVNTSHTYIFAAFAEHPTGGDGVSPATAR